MARGKTNQPDTKPQTTEATGEATTETVASVETTAETSAAPVDVNQEGEPAQEIQGVEVQSDTAGTGEAIKADEDTSSVPPVVVPTPQVSVSAESKSTSASEPVVLHHGGATIENITKPAAPVDVNQEGEPAQEIQGVEVQSDTAGTGEAIKADEDTSSVPPVVVPTPQVSVSAESKSTSASEPVVLHHGGATIENITKPAAPVDVNQGLTKVVINYPEDYKGQRHYKNGAIAYVSKESAAAFVKAGIARIL